MAHRAVALELSNGLSASGIVTRRAPVGAKLARRYVEVQEELLALLRRRKARKWITSGDADACMAEIDALDGKKPG